MSHRWEARLIYGCALWTSGAVHQNLVSCAENTPSGMFVYHFSAVAFDCLLIICAANLLRGRLSRDMQNLCWLSMIVNFIGWLLYMAYAPPITYNYAIAILGYVQYARLIYLGQNGINSAGYGNLRRDDFGGPQLHYETAK